MPRVNLAQIPTRALILKKAQIEVNNISQKWKYVPRKNESEGFSLLGN
jgi:hypothetical protein